MGSNTLRKRVFSGSHTHAYTHTHTHIYIYIYIYLKVFFQRTGPSLQAQKPRLQFCRRQVFHRKLRNQGCNFTRVWIVAVASRCFPHHTLSLVSGQTVKDQKRSQGTEHGSEESGFGQLGPPDFTEIHHRD